MDNALTLKDGKIAELEHRCIQAEELNSSNWKEIKLLKQRIAELEKSLELINNHHLEHHEDINAALQQAYDRCADLESELRRALDVVCVEPVMSAPCNRCGVHKYGFCGGCKHKENMNTVLKSGDAEVQCPIKGLCQTQNPINIDQAENQSNTKTFVHSWEQSLKRRKRAPETVGGKDESH
jgi:TolA-binding protein